MMKKILPLLSDVCAGVLLALLVLDALFPDWDLFLSGITKAFILAAALLSAVCGAMLVHRQRRAARRRAARKKRAVGR